MHAERRPLPRTARRVYGGAKDAMKKIRPRRVRFSQTAPARASLLCAASSALQPATRAADDQGVKSMLKKVSVFDDAKFGDGNFHSCLVHDSEHFKMLNFNFKAGQSLPVHSHDIEGQLSIVVLSGKGAFLSKDDAVPAKAGDVFISDIAEPHGLSAATDMQVLVTIVPPV